MYNASLKAHILGTQTNACLKMKTKSSSALQQRLRATLSVNGAGLVRYLYGLPVALVMWFGYAAAKLGVVGPLLDAFDALLGLRSALVPIGGHGAE